MRETLDYGSWWVQGYQSEAFGAHGDVFRALTGNGPYVVPKDGGAVFTFSSAEPVDTQMDRLRSATEVMRRALAAASHSPDEAGQFVEMVRSRRYVPFRATTPATAFTRDVASVLALRFLSTPSDTDGVERILFGEPVDAGSGWVFFFQGGATSSAATSTRCWSGICPSSSPSTVNPRTRSTRVKMQTRRSSACAKTERTVGESAAHEAVLEAIRAEGLCGYRWFEGATNHTDVVVIQRTAEGWIVFATDERATPLGRRLFFAEDPALENFLSRLRARNSVAAWEAEHRRVKAGHLAVATTDDPANSDDSPVTAASVAAATAESVKYFVREHRIGGQLVPVRLFRRRVGATSTTDELLVDVDEWVSDTRGVLDRAIRFPLESDLEEISEDAARDVFEMAAARTYVPLRRR